MKQHDDQELYDSKYEFTKKLTLTPESEHAALAEKYGWQIVDLTHTVTGEVVKGHLVDSRSSVQDDIKVRPAKNGERGGWSWAYAGASDLPKPAEVAEDAKPV